MAIIKAEYLPNKIMTRPKDVLFPGGYKSEDSFRVFKVLPLDAPNGFNLDDLPQAIVTDKNGIRHFRVFSQIVVASTTFIAGGIAKANHASDEAMCVNTVLNYSIPSAVITPAPGDPTIVPGITFVAGTFKEQATSGNGISQNAILFCNIPLAGIKEASLKTGDIICYYVKECINGTSLVEV
jgi:hypothetical protein